MSLGPGGPSSPPPPKVFICYRREETAAHAGRLYDAMVARFGKGNVFMDVDMAPGVDFVEQIPEVVAGCQVLIVVIGPSWATAKDEQGGVRIVDPEDFVRLEVETGLRRPDMTPIPVLVSGARMPKREDLPPEVQSITRRNALELSEARWGYDVGRLNSTLDELLADLSVAPQPPSVESGVEAGEASPAVDGEAPVETGRRSIVGATAPEESRAARRVGGGRLPRWALLGATAIAAIAVAVVLAVGGGGGACGPACVIETAFKSTSRADCTRLQTKQYLVQTRFKPYPAAVTRCRAAADNAVTKPASVEVSNVREPSADTATAEASPSGGIYDGQTMILALVREGNQWKLDKIKKFRGFDKGTYEQAYEEIAPNELPPQTRSHVRCVIKYLAENVMPVELEQAILKGDNAPFAHAYEEC